jgi:hypothetical protein
VNDCFAAYVEEPATANDIAIEVIAVTFDFSGFQSIREDRHLEFPFRHGIPELRLPMRQVLLLIETTIAFCKLVGVANGSCSFSPSGCSGEVGVRRHATDLFASPVSLQF